MTFFIRRTNKYGAKRQTFGGNLYDSKKEAGFAQQLEMLKRATKDSERVVDIKRQYIVDIYVDKKGKLTLKPTTFKICRIIPDFLVTYADDHEEICEVKGFATEYWRLKWKLLEAVMNVERPETVLTVYK